MITQSKLLVFGGLLLMAGAAMAEEAGVEWKTLTTAKVPLEKGLAAAKQKGNPISGKFEMEEGKLQLSTYTATKGKYWEVIVDHKSGKIVESKEIKEGDDLKHAQEQTQAMAKAKKSPRCCCRPCDSGKQGIPCGQRNSVTRTGNPCRQCGAGERGWHQDGI
jgi:hypothetical protein